MNVIVKEKQSIETLPGVVRAIEKAEKELGTKGRVLVRYSGTQPMCRDMIEATTQEIADRLTESIAAEIRKAIGT